ncbi:hypothetical protein VaNZ11_003688 [Volvox africanus]|uniref:MLO-like protein n=1 Tax=Volvox africanus TaxID=51714 RepID=A0ABQ5RUN4_9CHLO|nr:hypothetical protein VaNZ11_003688 [Volvox africanus]
MSSTVVHPSTVVEGWRMALLLLAFATVTFILEKSIHSLEHAFKNRRGLTIALEHIKNELLFVGSISLLLSAFQNLLAQICIPKYAQTIYTDRRRHLLAASSTTFCEPNKQSLWPVSLQHDTHIFIFVVACTHVVYGTITVYLTIWRVRSWRKWEDQSMEQARSGDMKVLKVPPFVNVPTKFLYRNVGSNPVIHFFLMLFRQYHLSVNQTLYNNARVLFIEQNGKDLDFNFHAVVIKGLEDELMHTLHPEWHLWIIAVIWYAIPPPAYVSFWMYGIALLIIMLVGGKLVDILVQIAVQVVLKYGESVMYGRMDDNPLAHGRIKALGRSSMRTIESTKPSFQQQFMEKLDKFSKLLEPATRDGSDVTEQRAGGPSSLVQGTMASLGALFHIPSGEMVIDMLRPGTSITREAHGQAQGQPQPAEKAAGADERSLTTPATPGASAIAGEPPMGKKLTGADGGGTAAAVESTTHQQHMGLKRLSAPAELRRQQGQRFQSPRAGTLDADNTNDNGHVAHVVPPVAKRHMSIITEHSTRHHQLRQQQQQQHNHHGHHHDPRDHDRARLNGRGDVQHQHQQVKSGGSPSRASLDQLEPARPPVDRRNSAFEMFQHHPGHRPRALSIRHALHNILSARWEPNTSPQKQQQLHQELLEMGCGRLQGDTVAPANGTIAENAAVENAAVENAAVENAAVENAAVENAADADAVLADGSTPRKGNKSEVSVAANRITAEITSASSGEVAVNSRPLSGTNQLAREPSNRRRPKAFPATSGCYNCESFSSGDEDGVRRGRSILRPIRTASGRRRKVPLLMRPFYCGTYVKGSREYVQDMLGKSQQLDAMELFWLKRPRFMTMLFTLAYFQNSLSIAICIFALAGMQDAVSTWQNVPKWAIILQLFLDVLLVPQVSLSILPFYALIQPLGSHCSKDIIEYATQKDEHVKHGKNRTLKGLWRLTQSNYAPTSAQGRSILVRLGFLGPKKFKRESPLPPAAEAPAEAPLPPVAHQLSYRLAMKTDRSKSFAPARTSSMSPFGKVACVRTASAAFPSRFKPNGTSGGAVRTASLRASTSVSSTEPQPAALQLDVWNPISDADRAPKRADSVGHRTQAVAGDQQLIQPQVQVVVGRQSEREREPESGAEPEPDAGQGPQTQADVGRPQPTEVLAAAAGAAPGVKCAHIADPLMNQCISTSSSNNSGVGVSGVSGNRGLDEV